MVPSTVVNDDDESPINIRDSLNPQFVKTFDESGLPAEYLTEFVYALDHLAELLASTNFPADRLLTSPDIINYGDEAVNAFNHNSRQSYSSETRPGVAVSQATLDSLQEFFELNYPRTINKLLRAMKIPGITVSLDNEPRYIGITYGVAHPHFCILVYRDLGKEIGLSIPLLLQRLD